MPLDGCEVKREIVGVSARGGKAVEGHRTPGRCRVHQRPTDGAKRPGVRQPSGALGWTLFHPLDHEHFHRLTARHEFEAELVVKGLF